MSSSSALSRDMIGAMANRLLGAHYYGLQQRRQQHARKGWMAKRWLAAHDAGKKLQSEEKDFKQQPSHTMEKANCPL
jgi:hypothetical protein